MIKLFQSISFRMPFYAVAKGKKCGVFLTWAECEEQVKGFKGASFKKFNTRAEALAFSNGNVGTQRMTVTDTPTTLVSPFNTIKAGVKRKAPTQTILLDEALKNDRAKLRVHTGNQHRNPTTAKKIGDHIFNVDQYDFVHVYTDGSCFNNGTKDAVAGYGIYFGEDHELNRAEPVSGRATNNCGEIQAAVNAIRLAHENNIERLCINTDSMFLINSACKWMTAWKAKGWKLSSGGDVRNRIDFEALDAIITRSDMTIKWNYVPAHQGLLGNERADDFAKDGSVLYKRCKLLKK